MKSQTNLVFISGGGTGGHAFPAYFAAKALMDEHPILWMGRLGSIEERLANKAHLAYHGFIIEPVRIGGPLRRIKSLWMLLKTILGVMMLIFRHKPAAVFSFGGYASFPTAMAAVLMGVPLCIHEQNAKMGMANRILKRFAKEIWLGLKLHEDKPKKQSKKGIQKTTAIKEKLIGNPSDVPLQSPSRYESRKGPVRIALFGGSGGARALNLWMVKFYEEITQIYPQDVRPLLWHQCGVLQFEETQKYYEDLGIPTTQNIDEAMKKSWVCLVGFTDNVQSMYAWADLAFARGGAMSLAELRRSCIPSWIIPLPSAADNHQYHNVRTMMQADSTFELLAQQNLPKTHAKDFDAYLGSRSAIYARALGIRPDEASKNLQKAARIFIDRMARRD